MELFVSMMLPFPLSSCSLLFSTRRQRLRVSDPGNLLVVHGLGGGRLYRGTNALGNTTYPCPAAWNLFRDVDEFTLLAIS